MTSSLLWKDISSDQVSELMVTYDPDRLKSLLASYLGLRTHEATADGVTEEELILDFHFHNFAFAKEQRFDEAKTSTLLSILKAVFDEDQKRVPIGDKMSESFRRFERLLLEHSVERPPISAGIFAPEDVEAITHYVLNGYYRHFKLYEYALKGRVLMTLEQTPISGVESVKAPMALGDGILLSEAR